MPLKLTPESFVLADPDTKSLVTYHPCFLSVEQADDLFAFMQEAPWAAETPVMFGKPVTVRRKTCAYGDAGLSYGYSGMRKTAAPWEGPLLSLRQRLSHDTGCSLNFALANLYPDGKAGLGAHADDEKDIEEGTPIVGISLGSTRDFVLTTRNGEPMAKVPLTHGSAIVMWGNTQKHFKHAVPARTRVTEPRVSLTFRKMVPAV